MKDSPLISVKDFFSIMNEKEIVIIDASNGKGSKERFFVEHITNAIHVDLETQLSTPTEDASVGGRHPLPSEEKFAKVLSSLGVSPGSKVIIYDDNNGGIASARFWWMLIAFGHEKVQVLNGGFKKAKEFDVPLSSAVSEVNPTNYPVRNWNLPTVTFEEMKKASKNENALIIDVRSPERYAGITEPIDKKAGHIPSAINLPYADNMNEKGLFKSPEELKEMYAPLFKKHKEVIVHCGSGVTACHTILAMKSAGLSFPKLYVGSWSEWSRREF